MKRYRVKLSTEERQELKTLVSRGRAAAYKETHGAHPPFSRGQALLLSDEAHADGAMKDEDIARVLQIGRATVERVRRRCVEEGLERALGRKEQLNRRQKRLDGQGEAHSVSSTGQALALKECGEPPEGRAGWTLKLLADRLVECEIVESISTETVRQTLKKTNSRASMGTTGQFWLKECWCIPPQGSAEVVCAMEDVLEVYQRQHEDNEAHVCLDETSKQQVKETQRGEQPFHVVRAPGRVAPGGSDGPAHQSRLGPGGQATGGRGLPAQGPYCAGDGQLEHPPPSLICMKPFEPAEARRIAPTVGGPLHSQAWQLAGYGRD